jgi:hypothetical protein
MAPEHCSKSLKTESRLRAEKAELDGALSTVDGELLCECGAHVGSISKPHLDGPKGGPLHPTRHYPAKPNKPYRSGKRAPSKSSGR